VPDAAFNYILLGHHQSDTISRQVVFLNGCTVTGVFVRMI